MPNSITVCMTWGGKVEIYVNGELVDTLSPSHRCWSKYIGEYGGMVAPGSRITINAIPDEGMEFEKYEVFYFPIPDGEIREITQNPWSFTLYDREIRIEVYFREIPKPTATVHVNKAMAYTISGHVMRFYQPIVHLLLPDGAEVAKFAPPINASASFGFRVYIDNKVCVSGGRYTTCGEKVMSRNVDVTVEFENEEIFSQVISQPYLLYKVSRGSQVFRCTADPYSGSAAEFSGYLIAPDGRQIPIVKEVPRKVVVVRVNVISPGTPPTKVIAAIDDTKVGEITVEEPGTYEVGEVEVEPGRYVVKADAVDSRGLSGSDEREVEVT